MDDMNVIAGRPITGRVADHIRPFVDVISKSVESLVASCMAKQPFPDLDHLCNYIQWTADFKRFQKASKEYMQRVRYENEALIENARRDFRVKHAHLRETII